jgi:hypothetical protein
MIGRLLVVTLGGEPNDLICAVAGLPVVVTRKSSKLVLVLSRKRDYDLNLPSSTQVIGKLGTAMASSRSGGMDIACCR